MTNDKAQMTKWKRDFMTNDKAQMTNRGSPVHLEICHPAARRLPVLGWDAGLAEDLPEERDANIAAVRIGDADGQRSFLHEGVLSPRKGAFKSEVSEPADQLAAGNGPKHSGSLEWLDNSGRLLEYADGSGSLKLASLQGLLGALRGTVQGQRHWPTRRDSSGFRQKCFRLPGSYIGLFLKRLGRIESAWQVSFDQKIARDAGKGKRSWPCSRMA